MSGGAGVVVRRALQVCRVLQKRASVAAVASSSSSSSSSSSRSHVQGQTLLTPRSSFYWSFRCFSDVGTISKESDSDKSAERTPVLKARAAFMEELSSCTSPSDVLDLSCRVPPTFLQLSHCLSQIWNSTKKMSEEQRRLELRLMWEHPEWERLLQRAVGGVSYLPDTHLVFALLSLVNLGVGPKTRVIQTYLRAAQERINELDDKNLSILSACLENLEEGANVRALKHGIRLLVEERLPRINNVVHLQTMMRIVGKDAPLKLKHKLEAKALSLSHQFSLPNAQHMVSTMATMGLTSKPLLSICSHKISENLSGVPFNRLLTVLVSCRELRFRDVQLLEAVSEYSATMVQVWNNKQHRSDWSVKDGELLEEHYYIDAVLTKRESDSEKEQRRAVLCVPPSVFCFGTSRPRGTLALKLRHLNIMGYLPLLVPEQKFVSLSDEARVQFLRKLIFPNEQEPQLRLELRKSPTQSTNTI
ncbi:FAST kinase domain-containing protein 2, mitochondrial isoform X2 [Boleophthalmus pectinirostris]|uniref:FAST kinase domain-containing protein 2, mitochondrial isoform X2 n=1 Tax=Boleophthalmus pectinirostris TaxID=150288 RepID=UPI00242FAD45|nr:FAST kinase domain-containing protein 2, mitochondrial isoform X2 [Boleophthalmus pectinirostris]